MVPPNAPLDTAVNSAYDDASFLLTDDTASAAPPVIYPYDDSTAAWPDTPGELAQFTVFDR